MRDLETIQLTITAAETGHLVLELSTHLQQRKQLNELLMSSLVINRASSPTGINIIVGCHDSNFMQEHKRKAITSI